MPLSHALGVLWFDCRCPVLWPLARPSLTTGIHLRQVLVFLIRDDACQLVVEVEGLLDGVVADGISHVEEEQLLRRLGVSLLPFYLVRCVFAHDLHHGVGDEESGVETTPLYDIIIVDAHLRGHKLLDHVLCIMTLSAPCEEGGEQSHHGYE